MIAASASRGRGPATAREIVDQQRQLAVARRRQHQPVEEFGEAVHAIIALVLVADEVERPRGDAGKLAPAHQRLLAAMRDPDLRGAGLADRRGQLVPVGMVGDDQRQLDAALLGALADAHPARGEAGDRIGKAARPAVGEGRGRADDDRAGEIALRPLSTRRRLQLAEIDAAGSGSSRRAWPARRGCRSACS